MQMGRIDRFVPTLAMAGVVIGKAGSIGHSPNQEKDPASCHNHKWSLTRNSAPLAIPSVQV